MPVLSPRLLRGPCRPASSSCQPRWRRPCAAGAAGGVWREWLGAQPGLERRPVGCAGFCFGGHLALLAATCDFCGAWVSTDRPGGGLPTLAELPQIGGTLQCFCGDHDPLMPPEELVAIRTALAQAGQPPLIVAEGAGHGFMCEARADFNPEAAAQGWQRMLALFAEMP